MKNINIILLTLVLGFVLSYAENNATVEQSEKQTITLVMDKNESATTDISAIKNNEDLNTSATEEPTQEPTQEDDNSSSLDDEDGLGVDVVEEGSEGTNKNASMSEFEKLFVHHAAYIYYNKAIDAMFQADYKTAYDYAMSAQKIYDNTDLNGSQVIALPYMPSYIRESAYAPKRIYYKMVKPKPYELRRVITKIKLISPPIASVVVKRTSTYVEIITKNYGDLPLDRFELFLNDEKLVSYEKILPNEQKVFHLDGAPQLYELSFKEKYGFAPKSILLSEGE